MLLLLNVESAPLMITTRFFQPSLTLIVAVEEFLMYLINNNVQKKFYATFGFNKKTISNLKKVRPYPQGFIVVSDSKSCEDFYQLVYF